MVNAVRFLQLRMHIDLMQLVPAIICVMQSEILHGWGCTRNLLAKLQRIGLVLDQ